MAGDAESPFKRPRVDAASVDEAIAAEDAAISSLEAQLRERAAARVALVIKRDSDGNVGFLEAHAERRVPDCTELLQLLKWNTPTVYNGWEQITVNPNYGRECFNLETVTDHMPQMGPMCGFAVTVKIRPGDRTVAHKLGANRQRFRDHIASLPAHLPKIVVVEDQDKPLILGSMWGEVNATYFKAVGAVGCLVDGGVRDLDEMAAVGFHAMSRGLCIGHSFGGIPVEWDCPVTVFGVTVRPGQLIHADKHGFLVVPPEDQPRLLEATEYMDLLERQHTIVPGRESAGQSVEAINARMAKANAAFGRKKEERFGSYDDRFGSSKVEYKKVEEDSALLDPKMEFLVSPGSPGDGGPMEFLASPVPGPPPTPLVGSWEAKHDQYSVPELPPSAGQQ